MKNKKIVAIVLILGIIAVFIGIAICNSFKGAVTPEGIVKSIVEASKYSTDISYTCKNSRGDFTEQGTLNFSKEEGATLNLGYVEQNFNEDKIKIHYFEDKEKAIEDKTYTVDRSYDEFYKYFMLNELTNYLKDKEVAYKVEVKDDKEIILVEFLTNSKNVNFHKAILEVSSEKASPEALTIYDNKGKERVLVKYNNYKNK